MKFLKLGFGLVVTLLFFLGISIIPILLIVFDFMFAGIAIFILYYLFNFIFIIDAFSNKRSDKQSKISWLIILLLPLATFFLYMVTSKIFFIHKQHNLNIKKYEEELFTNNREYFLNSEEDTFDILIGGDRKFASLLNDLKQAENEILIEYFILNEGIIWKQIENILIDKANKGLKIKIITDFAGNIQNKDSTYKEMRNHQNIDFFEYNKIIMPFTTGYSNLRSHNKIVIIDNKVGYFGGFNIGDDYSSAYSKYGYWYDVHFRTTNSNVILDLQKQYEIDWFRITKQKTNDLNSKLKIKSSYENKNVTIERQNNFQSIMDGYYSDEPKFLNQIIKRINNSKKNIKIVSPYLIIPNDLIHALINAAKRNVKIEIITTGRPDKKSAYFSSRYYTNKLSKNGIYVYRTNNFFLHAKYYIFDDEISLIGTSNIDSRSIYLHYEYNFIFSSQNFSLKLINESWNDLIKYSYLVKNENKIFPNWFVKLISPML